jgi:putative two-component system response regulator
MNDPLVRTRRPGASQQPAIALSLGDSSANMLTDRAVCAVTSRDLPTLTQTRILVVDDDDAICELLARVLRRSNMGGMTGLELTSLAGHLHPETPVVLMTGHRDTELMRAALRQGAVDFIPKPFDFDVIPIIIERNLERRAINRELSEEYRQIQIFSNVQVLAAAIDAKEPFTAQHSRRVARLCRATADAMKLSAADRQSVDWAAQVHDVGKIATPDHILLKAGGLTDAEWDVVRQHPTKGARIVGQVPDLQDVADVVRSHHEWVDGSGYPDGLEGEEIPLLARIIAVADAFEVMTSNRVYRGPVSEDEALMRLADGVDLQFDRAVVDAFVSLPRRSRR